MLPGVETGLYLAMTSTGQVTSTHDGEDEAAVWVEAGQGAGLCYLSRQWAHRGWYLAVKRWEVEPARAR